MTQLTYAYLLAAVSTLCWGIIVIPIKLARIPGRLGIGISMLTGATAMSVLAGREMIAALAMPPGELARFVAAGSFQFALGCMLYYESIRRGSVSIAVPVTRVKVIITLFLAIGLGLEVFKWSLLGACVLVVIGGVLIGIRPRNSEPDGPGKDHRTSLLLAIFACLCWACGETLIGTLPKDISPIAVNGLLIWSGLVLYAVYILATGTWRQFATVPRRDFLCYFTHGLISFSVAYVFFVKAVSIAGPPRISCITSTYPLISAAIGFIVFKERFSWAPVFGALLLVCGVILLQFA